MCRLRQKLIPLLNVSPDYKPTPVFIKLIKPVCNFLTICLNGKIRLPERDHFFSRITVLYDKITGIARQFIIFDCFIRCPSFHDFPDLRKIVQHPVSTGFASYSYLNLSLIYFKSLTFQTYKPSSSAIHSFSFFCSSFLSGRYNLYSDA